MTKLLITTILLSLAAFSAQAKGITAEQRSCAASLLSSTAKSEIKAKKAMERFESAPTQTCLKNVPDEYLDHPDFMSLAFDPDQKTIDKHSIREAMAAIYLVRSGRVQGPIRRGVFAKSADFIDNAGRGVEIKAKSSPRGPEGDAFDPLDLVQQIREKFDKNYINPRTHQAERMSVYIDLTWLVSSDQEALMEVLPIHFSPEELRSIEFFELPEPQTWLDPSLNFGRAL